MNDFTLFTAETASAQSKPLLDDSLKLFGMIPNLHAVMADSPAVLEGYQALHRLFQETSFNKDELTVIWLAINVENECHYCVPAHTGIAYSMGVKEDVIEALRNEQPLADPKLEALRGYTLKLLRQHGQVEASDTEAFLDAGYEQRHILEIILGISQKVLSNYVNHVAATPVDKPFQKFAWKKK